MRTPVCLAALIALAGCLFRAPPPPPAAALIANDACAAALRAEQYDEAQVRCEYALEFAPEYADAINNLGLVALARGELEVARGHFIRAVRLQPQLATAHNNIGVVRRREGRLKAAVESFRAALAVVPQYAEARLNLGAVCVQLGDEGCARKAYAQVLLGDPTNGEAHRSLGDLALRSSPAQAETHYTSAVLANPSDSHAWNGRGQALLRLRRVEDARDAFERCVDEGDDGGSCRASLARLPARPPTPAAE